MQSLERLNALTNSSYQSPRNELAVKRFGPCNMGQRINFVVVFTRLKKTAAQKRRAHPLGALTTRVFNELLSGNGQSRVSQQSLFGPACSEPCPKATTGSVWFAFPVLAARGPASRPASGCSAPPRRRKGRRRPPLPPPIAALDKRTFISFKTSLPTGPS